VVVVVSATRVRRLDRAQLGEARFRVAPELLDVLDQRLARRQPADEEPQEEGFGRARLDRLVPGREGTATLVGDRVELLVRALLLPDVTNLGET
jgi:hypothetical protein